MDSGAQGNDGRMGDGSRYLNCPISEVVWVVEIPARPQAVSSSRALSSLARIYSLGHVNTSSKSSDASDALTHGSIMRYCLRATNSMAKSIHVALRQRPV